MTDEFKLPEYDEAAMREIWFDDHADFAEVESRLEDATRWGHTESKVVRHIPSDTLWMFTADVASGDQGETTVDDELTRVYPHEATIRRVVGSRKRRRRVRAELINGRPDP
jgi:hypothetical protein